MDRFSAEVISWLLFCASVPLCLCGESFCFASRPLATVMPYRVEKLLFNLIDRNTLDYCYNEVGKAARVVCARLTRQN
jgi:hypothetical protein